MKILKYFLITLLVFVAIVGYISAGFFAGEDSERLDAATQVIKDLPSYSKVLKSSEDSPSIFYSIFKILGILIIVGVTVELNKNSKFLQRYLKIGDKK